MAGSGLGMEQTEPIYINVVLARTARGPTSFLTEPWTLICFPFSCWLCVPRKIFLFDLDSPRFRICLIVVVLRDHI